MKNLLVVVALLAACGPKTPVAPAPAPAPVETAAPVEPAAAPVETSTAPAEPTMEKLPPAFDADTLRKGFKQGTVIRYQMAADIKDYPWVEEWTVTAADDTGCTLHTKAFGPDGVTVTEENDHTMTWTELAGYGHYPAANTTRTESTVDVLGQHLATVYYEQHETDSSGTTLIKTHFAPAYVGPPVWAQMSLGDEVIFTQQMLSYTAP